MKEEFSVNLQTTNLCFPLKLKLKKKTDCPNNEYNAAFKHIHQYIRAYLRSKKSVLINSWENVIAY